MAHADKKHFGKASHGKGSGGGAMTRTRKSLLGENMVLSNRDKSRHSRERGLDSREIQTEQYQDHVGSHSPEDREH
jgi:hypothetical protein